MSIHREERTKVADAIERYLRCEINNFELDDIFFAVRQPGQDRTTFEIATQVWYFYDDCKKHKNEHRHKIPEAGEVMLNRWVLLLRSDREWPINEPDSRTDKWYSLGRWRGVLKPVGCLLALVALPIALFEVIVLGHPKPKAAGNEYWPFSSAEEWATLAPEHDPRFLQRIEAARRSLHAGRGVRMEDVEE